MGVLSDILMFSPLLVIGYSIFYFIDNRHKLRKGVGIESNTHIDVDEAGVNLMAGSDDGISSEDTDIEENENDGDEFFENNDIGNENENENNENENDFDDGEPNQLPRQRKNRIVGAKKSRSIEKRDKKRQYNEFVRQQAMSRKLAEKEWQDKYGDIIAAESEARDYRESMAALELKRRKESMKEVEIVRRKHLEKTRDALLYKLSTKNKVRITTDEKLVVKDLEESLLKQNIFLVNNGEWLIKLGEKDIINIKQKIRESGSMTVKDFGEYLKVNV